MTMTMTRMTVWRKFRDRIVYPLHNFFMLYLFYALNDNQHSQKIPVSLLDILCNI